MSYIYDNLAFSAGAVNRMIHPYVYGVAMPSKKVVIIYIIRISSVFQGNAMIFILYVIVKFHVILEN